MKSPLVALFLLGSVSVPSIQIFAQVPPAAASAGAQLEVTDVKFNTVRFGGDIWMESEIELDVKPGGRLVSGEYVNRARITLGVLFEATDGKGQKRNTFYRATAEAISLEGGKATVRFYLPPELVKRDRLRTDVKFYAVDLEVGGEPQVPTKAAAASEFKGPESVKNFQAKVSAEGGSNEGLLMPQHLTPFAYDAQRHSPTILRREPQR